MARSGCGHTWLHPDDSQKMQPSQTSALAEPLLDASDGRASRPSFWRSAAILIGAIVAFTSLIALIILTLMPPSMATLALLAYCFGCRHGIDADHIAAIDNVTRRLVASGRRPMTVGLFFSLGHCTVVLLLCLVVMASANVTNAQLESWASAGGVIGPWVAAAVLLIIGSLNVCVARDLWAQWRERQARGHEHEIASLVGRCCPSCVAAIDQPWKVVWIGLLFGLGLDTATEIGLLTLSALAQPEVPRAGALVLPLLFAAGMALVDSINSLLMLWAYEWATDNGPMHRLYFALFLTGASASLALFIGAVEALGQLVPLLPPALRDPTQHAALAAFCDGTLWLSDHLELLGLGSVLAFVVAIAAAVTLAHRCTPSQKELELEAQSKVRTSLNDYLKRGEFIVRVDI